MNSKLSPFLFLSVIFMITIISITGVNAEPGVTINISHSIFTGRPVHIEYDTALGEDGTIILFIRDPDGEIVWSFGPEIIGGHFYNITVTGITDKVGYYFVHAEVTLESGEKISNIVPFSKIEPIDTSIEKTESKQVTSDVIESTTENQSKGFSLRSFSINEISVLLVCFSVFIIIIILVMIKRRK